MAQSTNPALSRAPVSVRKLIQIVSDPVIFGGIAASIALASIGTYLYYSNKPLARVLDQHATKQFKLIEKRILTHNTAIYRFALPRGDDVLGLPIGQHIVLSATIDGKEVSRSYTPTSSDNDKGYFELIIKTYASGALTQHLSKMNVGDNIGVRGPKGAFTYTPNMAREICMVAGGTGITPMLQIIRAILRNPEDQTKVRLIFGNVTKDDILLEKELGDLVVKHGNQFSVYHVLNEPPSEWAHGIGFITQQILEEKFPKPASDVKVLVCGPPPLVKAITNATTSIGFEAPRTVSKLTDQVFKF